MKHNAAVAEKAAKQKAEKTPSLMSLAVDIAIATSSFDALKAKLNKRITSSPALSNAAIIYAVNRLASAAFKALRSDIPSASGVESFTKDKRLNGGQTRYLNALSVVLTLYDIPLPISCIKLGDATAADLSDAKDYYLGNAEVLKHKGDMYRHLQERLARSNKPTVREAFTVDELRDILGDEAIDEYEHIAV